MTWSYNPASLASSSKDAVRLMIGDVLTTDQQMQDEEINYFIALRGSNLSAAAECCRALAAKFGRSVDQGAGTSKVAFSQMAKSYTAKAIEFDNKAIASGTAMPVAGGSSIADKLAQENNADRVDPQFTLGMTDNKLPEPSGSTETLER